MTNIDFDKQKYIFLNGNRYLVSDIKGYTIFRKEWKIIVNWIFASIMYLILKDKCNE